MLSEILTKDCFMLDIETTGLSSRTNGMTSVSLVRFNLNSDSINNAILDWAHFKLEDRINYDLMRVADLATMKFRREHYIDSEESKLPAVSTVEELTNTINQYLKQFPIDNRYVFALHTEFDISFLQGYYEAAGEPFPFKHRNILELSSLIAGLDQDFKSIRDSVSDLKITESICAMKQIRNATAHNALYDCIRQIAFLHRACWQTGVV